MRTVWNLQEEIKSRLNSGVLATILFKVSSLPVFSLKTKILKYTKL